MNYDMVFYDQKTAWLLCLAGGRESSDAQQSNGPIHLPVKLDRLPVNKDKAFTELVA